MSNTRKHHVKDVKEDTRLMPERTIQIEEATARLDGRVIDLLATHSLTPRDFRPLPIRF